MEQNNSCVSIIPLDVRVRMRVANSTMGRYMIITAHRCGPSIAVDPHNRRRVDWCENMHADVAARLQIHCQRQ
jgi:hypothetical protein